jgi:hypothetical protein
MNVRLYNSCKAHQLVLQPCSADGSDAIPMSKDTILQLVVGGDFSSSCLAAQRNHADLAECHSCYAS